MYSFRRLHVVGLAFIFGLLTCSCTEPTALGQPAGLCNLVKHLGMCAQNTLLRNDFKRCVIVDGSAKDCKASTIEVHTIPSYDSPPSDNPSSANSPTEYLLTFVEFDDQGRLDDPKQLEAIFNELAEADQPLSLITFVHGWKHNAEDADGNVESFRKLLRKFAELEAKRPENATKHKVMGIYVGWRGLAFDLEPLTDLTFGSRKDVAQRVALGSVRQMFARLKAFQSIRHGTRLLTIGHSFGGLIVYHALQQYFVDQAAVASMAQKISSTKPTPPNAPRPVAITGFGDLVVILNPALEAASFQSLRELSAKMAFDDSHVPFQQPVLLEITSEADSATGTWFPLGLWWDKWQDSFTDSNESKQASTTIGHYPPL